MMKKGWMIQGDDNEIALNKDVKILNFDQRLRLAVCIFCH